MSGIPGAERPALERVLVVERRPAAPHLVPVDDVVVDQEGGLNELDRRPRLDRGPARPAADPGPDGDHPAAEHLARLGERSELAESVFAPGVDPGVAFSLVPEEGVEVGADAESMALELSGRRVPHGRLSSPDD